MKLAQDQSNQSGSIEARNEVVVPFQEQLDLSRLLRTLRRRKAAIAAAVVILMSLITAIVLFLLTPRYTATAYVMVGVQEPQVVDVGAVVSGLPIDNEAVLSQTRIIGSRTLAAKTVEHLGLDRDPEFNATLQPPGAIKEVVDKLRDYLPAGWWSGSSETYATEQEKEDRERIAVIDAFVENLEVAQDGRSRVIKVAFRSRNPKTAASVVNTLVDRYIVSQLDAKFATTERVNNWLINRLSGLRDKVQSSERAIEEYREKTGLIQGKEVTLVVEEISELNKQIVLAGSARATAGAQLQQAEELLSLKTGLDTAGEVLGAPLIQKLREQEVDLTGRMAELSEKVGDLHPEMVALRAQIEEVETSIAAEISKIIQGLRNNVATTRARETALVNRLNELKAEVARANKAGVQMRALEREASASRTLLEAFLARSKETTSQQSFQEPDAQIVSFADVPQEPSFPPTKLFLVVGFMTSVFLALVLAFALDTLDQTVRSAEQLAHFANGTALGIVPELSSSIWTGRRPEDYVLDKPASAFTESIRGLYTDLTMIDSDRPPKVVLVASALPREGKTVIAASLARLLAGEGHSVAVIDCDVRRPSVHRLFKTPLSPGLVDLVNGTVRLEQVLVQERRSKTTVIPAGSISARAPELFQSERMKDLLVQLAAAYDIVILDSAPVLAASETRVLSRFADQTIFVIRWGGVSQKMAITALQQLTHAGGTIAGILLSRVNVRRHAQYDFADSGCYYGRLRSYYSG